MRHRLVAVMSSRNETVRHGRLVVRRHNREELSLNEVEWSASVMHSIECPGFSLDLLPLTSRYQRTSGAGLRRVQTTTVPGFCSHTLERSQARHDCSRGSEPVTWIGYNFRTQSLLLCDVISDAVFTNSLR